MILAFYNLEEKQFSQLIEIYSSYSIRNKKKFK